MMALEHTVDKKAEQLEITREQHETFDPCEQETNKNSTLSPLESQVNSPTTEISVKNNVEVLSTPLPWSQFIPMIFVALNEALSGMILMPFIGLMVAHLQGKPPEEAGYLSGALVGVFMLGQVISARTWGWISDQYGRRFPLISGLFVSGVIMLIFGFSSSVLMCGICRFFHGLFNGNILVAKTMMADITDKSNQAKGFSFLSLCSGIGFLIGPALGGMLYDPVNSSSLQWLHFDKDGIFARYTALLPSLVISCYSLIGVTVCTFLIKESNPKAKPLPSILKLIYPCMWYDAGKFVPSTPKLQTHTINGAGKEQNMQELQEMESKQNSLKVNKEFQECNASEQNCRFISEDNRLADQYFSEELINSAISPLTMTAMSRSTSLHYNQNVNQVEDKENNFVYHNNNICSQTALKENQSRAVSRLQLESETNSNTLQCTDEDKIEEYSEEARNNTDKTNVENYRESNEANTNINANRTSVIIVAEPEYKTFGYTQAFRRPQTRHMLIQYMLLAGCDVIFKQCLPLWAIASVSVGGLSFKSDMVGWILLFNSIPSFASNFFFHKAFKAYHNKMGLFRVGLLFVSCTTLLLPFTAYIPVKYVKYCLVIACTSTEQFFVAWCYSLNTLLTARSAPNGHVGSIMGINQSCAAITRGIVPFIITPLFAWSISGNHIFPFNFTMVFIISMMLALICWAFTYKIRSNEDCALEMVHENTLAKLYQQIKGKIPNLFSKREDIVTIESSETSEKVFKL